MDIFSKSTLSSMNTREKQLINDAVDAAENLATSLESLKSILNHRACYSAEDFGRTRTFTASEISARRS